MTQKLFAIKKIFYLSYSIKLHFFKTFILPHFDFCSSLFIYFSNTLLENIKGLYNNCLFHLLDLDFREKLRSLTVKSGKRLVNKVIRYSHYLEFKDFLNNLFFSIFLILLRIRFKFSSHQLLIDI